MKHAKKEITTHDIKQFMARFDNLEKLTILLTDKIGYPAQDLKNKVDLAAEDPKNLKIPTLMGDEKAVNLGDFNPEAIFNAVSTRDVKQYVKMDDNYAYVFDNKVGVKGINQHQENPYLYVTISPLVAEHNKVQNLPTFTQEATDLQQGQKVLAQGFFTEMLARIKNLHPRKIPTILVLGAQSFEFYHHYEKIEWVLDGDDQLEEQEQNNVRVADLPEEQQPKNEKEEDHIEERQPERLQQSEQAEIQQKKQQKIQHFRLNERNDIDLYWVNANTDNSQLNLDSQVLDGLWAIYNETIAKQSPLIIHDTYGFNLAPKLAFAFEILRNFDTIFASNDQYKIRDELFKTFEAIRRSRSPMALNTVQDTKEAVYLAFALKAKSLADECVTQLRQFVDARNNDPKFQSRAGTIRGLMTDFDNKSSKDIAELIYTTTLQNDELSSHHKLTFMPDMVRSQPGHTELLKVLRFMFLQKALVEEGVLEKCSRIPKPANQRQVRREVDQEYENLSYSGNHLNSSPPQVLTLVHPDLVKQESTQTTQKTGSGEKDWSTVAKGNDPLTSTSPPTATQTSKDSNSATNLQFSVGAPPKKQQQSNSTEEQQEEEENNRQSNRSQ